MPIEHLHPIAVHFPIVFVVSLFVVDLVAGLRGAEITGRQGAVATATMLIAVAAGAFALLAAALGDAAAEIAEERGLTNMVHDALETHEGLGSITAWAIALWGLVRLYFWWRDIALGNKRGFVWVADLVLVALVIATAWFGGNLVYVYGVNVAVGG